MKKTNLLRRVESHKGDYGHALVVAGSRGMAGAAWLAAQSAVLSGAGKVTLATPKEVYPLLAKRLVEVMTLPLPQTPVGTLAASAFAPIARFFPRIQVLALGPGLSTHASTCSLVRRLVATSPVPLVLDADGLNAFAGVASGLLKKKAPAVLTPHDGEFARLTGKRPPKDLKSRKGIAKEFAAQYDCTLVLKGSRTVVCSPGGRVYVNRTGNPGMATGGVGDVLTGIVTGFIAQGFEPFFASCLAVYAHGAAGDRAARVKGQTALIATDLVEQIPPILKRLEKIKNLKFLLE